MQTHSNKIITKTVQKGVYPSTHLKVFFMSKVFVTNVTGEWFLSCMYTLVLAQFMCINEILATKCTIKFSYNLCLPVLAALMFVEQFRLSEPNSADFTVIYWDGVKITNHTVCLKDLKGSYLSRLTIVTARKGNDSS
jgi:hypothetical protein